MDSTGKAVKNSTFDKPFIFITGAPRSGTTLITKIIDSHPDIAILMENIFENRRRYWEKNSFWNDSKTLRKEIAKVYSRLNEPIIGNKVATPDVWDAGDIIRFCNLFESFKIIYIVRDPASAALSRLHREPADFLKVFNKEARKNILLDFQSRFHTYISSWRQSVENYWKLKDALAGNIKLLYYEDFCQNFERQIKEVFCFLGIDFSEVVLRWFEFPHHNKKGKLVSGLKYADRQVFNNTKYANEIPDELNEVMERIKWQYDLWKNRQL
jgi:hypothetical protein